MVEYAPTLDLAFGSLSDPIRRDILRRLAGRELSVGEIAEPYEVTFAAVSKHIKVLEKAKLILKRRQGKQQLVTLVPGALDEAQQFLEFYKSFSEARMDSLEQFLKEES